MLNQTISSSDFLRTFNAGTVTCSNHNPTSLILNPIQDPFYNTQYHVTLPSITTLDSVRYDIDQLDLTSRSISRKNTSDFDDGTSNMSRSCNDPDYAMEEAGALRRFRIYDSPSSVAEQIRRVERLNQSNSGVLKVRSGFLCDCCSTKPKKFDTQEALNAHEAAKHYECTYCKHRFKNKNEAERHRNSVHLRVHSWSCALLTDYENGFHDSPSSSGMLDICGYCGDAFQRNGPLELGRDVRTLTESDLGVRVQHLVVEHKFRQCNPTKKFFRRDHFKQHLKHSHAGTSGEWTNMLENACMKDEPLAEPIRGTGIAEITA